MVKLTEYDLTIIRYNLLLNMEHAPVKTEKDKWMYEHSRYLFRKLERMQMPKVEKMLNKEFGMTIIGKKEFPDESFYYIKNIEEEE